MMLLDAYTSLLSAAGLSVKGNSPSPEQEGEVYINRGGETSSEKTLLLVGGKKLVLPVQYQLKNPVDTTWTTRILFHPFVEPAIRGAEDPVFLAYKDQLQMHANMCVMMQLYSLLAIAGDKDNHSTLTPEQSEVVSALAGVNEKVIKTFTNKIQKNLHVGKDIPYVRFYIRNTVLLDGEKFSRGCIVSFPVYEELVKDSKNEIMSASEKKPILAAFKFIFQNIDTLNFYSQGSSCKRAPTIVSLLLGYGSVAMELNRITQMFDGNSTFECPLISIDYDQYITDLSDATMVKEIHMIPHHANIQSYKETVVTPPPVQTQYQQPINAFGIGGSGDQYSPSDPRRYIGGGFNNQPQNTGGWSQFQTTSNVPTWATQNTTASTMRAFANAYGGNNNNFNNATPTQVGIYGY